MKYALYKMIKDGDNGAGNPADFLAKQILSIKSGHMNTEQHIEERLWQYIDGQSSPAEKSAIEALLDAHSDWRAKYKELLALQELIHLQELEAPSMRFTKNVMEEIAKYQVAPATRSYIDQKIIWGIGGFFLLTILGFLVYALASVNWSDTGNSNLITQYSSKLDWSRLFQSSYTHIFIMVNVILGLVLLDMYLQKKKKTRPDF